MWDQDSLLKKAQEYCERFEFDLAIKFCTKILHTDPASLDALELLSNIFIEIGRPLEAVELLLKCVELSPDYGYEKYMALGQLHTGEAALEFYQKASTVLESLLNQRPDQASEPGPDTTPERYQELRRELSSVLCCISELYLTDLCFEKCAEDKCEAFTQRAKDYDPTNPEVFRLEADIRLSQDRHEDALDAMKTCFALLNSTPPESPSFLSYDQQSAIARVLIEVGLVDEAVQVLEGLLGQDDKVINTWYLAGIAYKASDNPEAAIEAFEMASTLLGQEEDDDEDPDLSNSISAFLAELKETQ